jgi:hypothetical protein
MKVAAASASVNRFCKDGIERNLKLLTADEVVITSQLTCCALNWISSARSQLQ